ncbi:Tyrosine-protein kinase ptk [Microbulbifer aggregans]|uniref:non-specific protein-tyrosine kinase n=2 Tax=Microbulbifer aggregans TaxID=1769779 RepID=A0A1C9W7V6_9GAMM|nr:Tyrosine-protein kinase ptk [Microbulbifer aggregans]
MNDLIRNFPQDTAAQPEAFDIRQYIGVVNRFKWYILGLTAVATLGAILVTSALPKVYEATATLMVEAEQPKALKIEDVYGQDPTRQDYMSTQFEMLRSRSIAREVVTRLDLVNDPKFAADRNSVSLKAAIKGVFSSGPSYGNVTREEMEAIELEKVVDKVADNLTIEPVINTQFAKVKFESRSPEIAARVVNTVAEVFIDKHRESKNAMTREASVWLQQRLEDLRGKLEESEERLQSYQAAQGLVDVQGVQSLASQGLNEITTDLIQARKELKQAESLRDLVTNREYDINALASLPEVLNHGVIQDVKRAEVAAAARVSELSQRYGPMHPNMIAARQQLGSVQQKLRTEIRQLISGIENDFEAAQANVAALERELDTAKQDFRELDRKDTRHNELKREVEANRQLYNAFLTRYKETSETTGYEGANARLIDEALPPQAPSKPRRLLLIAAAFMGSLIGGLGLAFVYEAFNDSVQTAVTVQNKLGQQLLGMFPKVSTKSGNRFRLSTFIRAAHTPFAEAVRTLRTNFVLKHVDNPAKVVVVTSSVAGEGKTTVAENMALALAQMEKVVLVDADLRRPSVGKDFGLAVYMPGLSNLINGSNSLAECTYFDERRGLDILPSGVVPHNPQELLGKPQLAEVIKSLAEKYDRVIIDTPPIQVVSDALMVSRLADSTVYVVKANGESQAFVKTGLDRLIATGAKVDGVVLNQVESPAMSGYFGDYQGYEGGYGAGAVYGAGGMPPGMRSRKEPDLELEG